MNSSVNQFVLNKPSQILKGARIEFANHKGGVMATLVTTGLKHQSYGDTIPDALSHLVVHLRAVGFNFTGDDIAGHHDAV